MQRLAMVEQLLKGRGKNLEAILVGRRVAERCEPIFALEERSQLQALGSEENYRRASGWKHSFEKPKYCEAYNLTCTGLTHS